MSFRLTVTQTAVEQLHGLEHDADKKELLKLRIVRKCLGYLQTNPMHPSLKSHQFSCLQGVNDKKVWGVCAENSTPTAWRVVWHYGPGKGEVTVVAIAPYPSVPRRNSAESQQATSPRPRGPWGQRRGGLASVRRPRPHGQQRAPRRGKSPSPLGTRRPSRARAG